MPDMKYDSQDDDIHVRAVLRAGLAIVVALALTGVGAYAAWHAWRPDAPNADRDFAIAGAVLQSAPQTERAAFMAEKERLLHAHEWIDPAAGVARIPIDDAMRILSERRDGERSSATSGKEQR